MSKDFHFQDLEEIDFSEELGAFQLLLNAEPGSVFGGRISRRAAFCSAARIGLAVSPRFGSCGCKEAEPT